MSSKDKKTKPRRYFKDLISSIVSSGKNRRFCRALDILDIVQDFREPNGPFTIIAPSDEAFNKIGYKKWKYIWENPEVLKKVILSHVIDGTMDSEELMDRDEVTAKSGLEWRITAPKGKLHINGALVGNLDTMTKNGVHSTIDILLIPDDVEFPSEEEE